MSILQVFSNTFFRGVGDKSQTSKAERLNRGSLDLVTQPQHSLNLSLLLLFESLPYELDLRDLVVVLGFEDLFGCQRGFKKILDFDGGANGSWYWKGLVGGSGGNGLVGLISVLRGGGFGGFLGSGVGDDDSMGLGLGVMVMIKVRLCFLVVWVMVFIGFGGELMTIVWVWMMMVMN
ncbi:hypothetical protein LWI29_001706 [Acer saccharum]|uniref:Uncharacterized protein n=1 Tax=Acer saccharum TaxID=4024 RepID=A0AA39RUG0_ACESA|nr:hypothetical protein LWI29_001706 [Acer saccharum]